MTEFITSVGIMLDGQLWALPAPARHHHALLAIESVHPDKAIEAYPETQGFVTNTGRWVDRTEGAAIAIAAGQIEALKWPPYLYSEDLW